MPPSSTQPVGSDGLGKCVSSADANLLPRGWSSFEIGRLEDGISIQQSHLRPHILTWILCWMTFVCPARSIFYSSLFSAAPQTVPCISRLPRPLAADWGGLEGRTAGRRMRLRVCFLGSLPAPCCRLAVFLNQSLWLCEASSPSPCPFRPGHSHSFYFYKVQFLPTPL